MIKNVVVLSKVHKKFSHPKVKSIIAIAHPSNTKLHSQTVSLTLCNIEIGMQLKMMIGISTGVRNSLYQKPLIKLGYSRIKGLIILEIGMKFVGKIFSLKTLRNIKEH